VVYSRLCARLGALQVDLVFDLHEDFTTVESTIEVRPWEPSAPAGMPQASQGIFLLALHVRLKVCHWPASSSFLSFRRLEAQWMLVEGEDLGVSIQRPSS